MLVREGSPRGEKWNYGESFVTEVVLKPRVKERGSCGWAEWWIKRESEIEELYESTVDEEIKKVDSRDEVKHSERSDHLFCWRPSKSNKRWRASTTRTLHRDEVVKIAYIFTFIHQKAGSNNRKAKRTIARKKSNTKTQEHGAKSTQSATN